MTTAMWGKIAFLNGHHDDDDQHQGAPQHTLSRAYSTLLKICIVRSGPLSSCYVYAAVGQLRLDCRQHGCDASRVRLHQQDDDSR